MNQADVSEIKLAEQFNFAAYPGSERERAEKIAYITIRNRSATLSWLRARSLPPAARFGVHREERILLVMQDTVDMPVALLGHAGRVVPVR